MEYLMNKCVAMLFVLSLFACGSERLDMNGRFHDVGILRGRAVVIVSNERPLSYALSSATTTVTYTNASSTNFSLNVGSFTPGSFTGNTLSLGSFALATLDDNSLKICNPGGNTQCTSAIIRTYTTGSMAGFVNTAGSYGAPLFSGVLSIGLNVAGSATLETVAIASNKHRLRLSDFTTTTFPVTSDFSNAGSGGYSSTFTIEYVLQ